MNPCDEALRVTTSGFDSPLPPVSRDAELTVSNFSLSVFRLIRRGLKHLIFQNICTIVPFVSSRSADRSLTYRTRILPAVPSPMAMDEGLDSCTSLTPNVPPLRFLPPSLQSCPHLTPCKSWHCNSPRSCLPRVTTHIHKSLLCLLFLEGGILRLDQRTCRQSSHSHRDSHFVQRSAAIGIVRRLLSPL